MIVCPFLNAIVVHLDVSSLAFSRIYEYKGGNG
jgi:hypothetical protein